jgi:ribosomal protein L40E
MDGKFIPHCLVLVACSLLISCMDIHIRLSIRGDGTGAVTAQYEILPEGAALGLTAARLKGELSNDAFLKKHEARITVGRAPSGNEMVTAVVRVNNVNDLNGWLYKVSYDKSSDGSKCAFRLAGNNDVMPMVKVRLDVEMPGRILRSNADRVTGNVAHFDTFFRSEPLYAEAEVPRFAFIDVRIVAAAAGIMLLAAILMWAIRRNQIDSNSPAAAVPASANKSASVVTANPMLIRCFECGAQNQAGTRFCRQCGKRL